MKTDYLAVAIQLKELQERHKHVMSEFDRMKLSEKSLMEELKKDKCNSETQTHGVRIEELENDLKTVSSDNTSLHTKLNAFNVMTENLKRDLAAKNEEISKLHEKMTTTLGERDQNAKEIELLKDEINNSVRKCKEVTRDKDDLVREKDEAEEKLLLFQEK